MSDSPRDIFCPPLILPVTLWRLFGKNKRHLPNKKKLDQEESRKTMLVLIYGEVKIYGKLGGKGANMEGEWD